MSDNSNQFVFDRAMTRERSIIRNSFIWMAAALALTGVVALFVSGSPSIVRAIFGNPILFFGLMIGELALVWWLSARVLTMDTSTATLAFAGYAALNGLTLSIIFLAYTGASIVSTFFITAGTFAGMSIYAMTTKRSLAGWGNYLFMGLIGIIIASVVNIFLRSSGLYWIISVAGVLLFTGLTAYDVQRIKAWSDRAGDSIGEEDYVRWSIRGALKLYLDFINLFLFLLRILGRRR